MISEDDWPDDSSFEYVEIENLRSVPDGCPDPEAARKLLNLMGKISEDYYCAGWLMGLEFSLWRLAFENQGDHSFGMGELTFEEVGQLVELTHRCQGWWVWCDVVGGRKFLGYDEWLPMYQKGPEH